LKYLETIFDDMPNLTRQPSGQARRERGGVDVDEDLFAPAGNGRNGAKGGPNSGIVPSPILNPASSNARAMPASLELDERPWPTLDVPPKQGPSPLEKKVADQERELSLRCTQVADLYNLQERLSAELQAAHGEIDRLNTAFTELQETATHHVSKAAERKKAVTVLYQENAVLRGKLDKAHDETATLSRQMLSLETMFNDREAVITSALEEADLLKAQLAAANEEVAKLTATIDEANQRRQDEDSRQSGMIEDLKHKVESLFVDHGIQLKTRDKLAKRCDELTRTTTALETAQQESKAKLAAQAEHTRFLETVLRVERETADAKIKELTEKLEHERVQRAAADDASAAMRREMAQLLRQFAARRPHLQSSESGARQDAA
jgi:chromosome segregation ATPase